VTLDPPSRYVRAGFDCTVRARVTPPNPCAVNDGRPTQISIIGSYERPNQPRTRFGGITLFARSTRVAALILECPGNRPNYFTGQLLEESCLEGEQNYFRELRRINEPIALEYRSSSSQVMIRLIRTDRNGAFFDEFRPEECEQWSVQAHWISDQTHSPATSAPCPFEIVDTTPPVITCPDDSTWAADANCRFTYNELATATDNCDPDVTITSDPPLPATFGLGTHTVTFTATDAAGNTAICMTTVEVIDANPPVANAGPDQDLISTEPWVTITLDGTGSFDPDGQPLTYFWTQISGPPVTLDDTTSPTPSYVQLNDAQWREFRLAVTAACGVTATDTVMVRVRFP